MNHALTTPQLADAELHYSAHFLSSTEADRYLTELQHSLQWRQDQIRLFGRHVALPRLQAWYGDPDLNYRYSGLSLTTLPWPPALLALRQRIQQSCDHRFNAVLANLYRNGHDSMGWHADDEVELGPNPCIASLSLGQPRTFRLRRRDDPTQHHSIELAHGSLLIMAGTTQQFWQHALPKRLKLTQPRINLTFRWIR
ncbi:MAG: alpha-ketoglutarate-dependent dioxygenase AlkB [Halopseudomonas sp.]